MKVRAFVMLGLGYVAGCAVRPAPEGSSGSSSGSTGAGEAGESSGVPTTGGAGGTSMSTGAGTGGPTGTTGDSTGSDLTTGGESCDFVCGSTGEETGGFAWCDVFDQDCPEGEKCSAYAEGGGNSWNVTGCVPVGGDGQPGEPCTAQGGGVSGLDDCAKGVMCWDVDEMNQGTCVALCTGHENDPMCADGFVCPLVSEAVLNLCLPACDPLSQDCVDEDLCIVVAYTFACVVDESGEQGQVFDPCEFANACDKGLLCLNPSAATECDAKAGGCCMPMCDVTDPNFVCPGVGVECTSLYYEGMAPPEFAKVGICEIPG